LASIVVSALRSEAGTWIRLLASRTYRNAFRNSLLLSLWTVSESSVIGCVLAVIWSSRLHHHGWFLAFVNFAANNGGISLAFSTILILGDNGLVTYLLKRIGISIYPGFQLAGLAGLHWAYLSFLVPFMFLVFLPSVGFLREEWRDAARSLGAGRLKYFVRVACPLLFPFFLSSFAIVFIKALGAFATPNAISDGSVNLVPVQIGNLMQTALFNRSDADILSFLLVVVMAIVIVLYRAALKRSERWLK
jgi:putative spermidine/putrescine transport system permease protein